MTHPVVQQSASIWMQKPGTRYRWPHDWIQIRFLHDLCFLGFDHQATGQENRPRQSPSHRTRPMNFTGGRAFNSSAPRRRRRTRLPALAAGSIGDHGGVKTRQKIVWLVVLCSCVVGVVWVEAEKVTHHHWPYNVVQHSCRFTQHPTDMNATYSHPTPLWPGRGPYHERHIRFILIAAAHAMSGVEPLIEKNHTYWLTGQNAREHLRKNHSAEKWLPNNRDVDETKSWYWGPKAQTLSVLRDVPRNWQGRQSYPSSCDPVLSLVLNISVSAVQQPFWPALYLRTNFAPLQIIQYFPSLWMVFLDSWTELIEFRVLFKVSNDRFCSGLCSEHVHQVFNLGH